MKKTSTGEHVEGVISKLVEKNKFEVDFPDGTRERAVEAKDLILV